MVADEEPRTAQLMRALATPLGHTVLHFENYQTAGERGEAQPFDVAFVGMQLPESGGLELAHRIRKSQANHGTPIVMLSSTVDIPSLRKAFGEGADFVLTKPVQADRLRRMLAAMESPDWKHKRAAARLPMFSEVTCAWDNQQHALHSLNISESGMLLQPSLDAAIGAEISVAFKIAEVRASLNLRARITRKEGNERVALEFIDLAPEDRNAIEVYVTGHLTDLAAHRESTEFGPRRVFRP
jgi:CheY-like chemotaxis protein